MKLLNVDGLNLVRRVYEANPAPDSVEKAEGAMRASLSSLKRALREHAPTHALVAFDAGGRTWRHDIYEAYRNSRKPMPEPLKAVLPALIEHWSSLGFCVRQIAGVEADDTVATATTRAVAAGIECVVLSTDKDLVGLMGDKVSIRDHFKPEWRDLAWCMKKFGVPPHLLADLLALQGDSVDDIPGVDGVGAKTAAKLILEHGSLEAVLLAAPGIKGKLGQKLVEQQDIARLSRRLTALKTDVSLGIASWSELRCPELA